MTTPTPEALARMASALKARWEHIANTEAIAGFLDRAWGQLADAALAAQTDADCHPAALCNGPEQAQGNRSGCPCVYTTPCDPHCTCVEKYSSRGCSRCCRYGSEEQRRAAALRLAEQAQGETR